MATYNEDMGIFERISRIFQDVSDRQINEKLNELELTERVSKILEKQAELQSAMDALNARYDRPNNAGKIRFIYILVYDKLIVNFVPLL
ncbi:hypothetical protein Hdeb2414_s0002g00068021 [Helianthus debilis subsp. tardiflorus]